MQGLGVIPFEYASIKGSMTFSMNSSRKSTAVCFTPMCSAVRRASFMASMEQHPVNVFFIRAFKSSLSSIRRFVHQTGVNRLAWNMLVMSPRAILLAACTAAGFTASEAEALTPLAFEDEDTANLRISGAYRVGDNAAFARSVSVLLPVVPLVRNDTIVLAPAHGAAHPAAPEKGG